MKKVATPKDNPSRYPDVVHDPDDLAFRSIVLLLGIQDLPGSVATSWMP
jgi:hypothetical protein